MKTGSVGILDPWIKHKLFTEYLRQAGADWSSLAQTRGCSTNWPC